MSQLSQWLALTKVASLRARDLHYLVEKPQSISHFFSGTQFSTAFYEHFPHAEKEKPNWGAVERELKWAELDSHHILPIWQTSYPAVLKYIPDPPFVLYVVGSLAVFEHLTLAIVGSRTATMSGLKMANEYAAGLAEHGLIIVSGLAKGIDAAAHEGTVAVDGRTIGVLAHGLHRLYPKENLRLAHRILSGGGALVSEYGLGVEPQRWHFVKRNRIISGLSQGVLVVQAAAKSGSLTTARYALEQGREIFAIPGAIDDPLIKGCHALIREGAVLTESVEDILAELRFFRQARPLQSLA